MSQRQIQGHQELLDDAARFRALVISSGSVEERLRGLSPEDRLRGLPAEDRLRGLNAEEREQLRELLLKQKDS